MALALLTRQAARSTDVREVAKQSRDNERRIASIKARIARRFDNINNPVPFVKQIAR